MRGHRKRRDGGFTMVEVLIAVLLTAIAMAGLLGLYMVASRSGGTSRHSSEATLLAQDQMERLRTTATVTSGTQANLDVSGRTGGIFTRTWTVTNQIDFTDVVVSVTWNDDGQNRQVTLRSRRNK